MRRGPRILVVSPVPSHPADQGNAARILASARALMARGATLEFLYYELEGLEPAQEAAMRGFWAALHVQPAVPPRRQSFATHWGIDDWCPDALCERVAALRQESGYDAVLVHYVWLSAALEGAGKAQRLLDTHDLFGDRHLVARRDGLDPSWFFTSVPEESRGLDRADLVLAVQEEEAAELRRRTARPVLTLGHPPTLDFLADSLPARGRAPFGWLGSGNPWNLRAVTALDEALADAPDLPWLLAGRILRRPGLALHSAPLLLPDVPDPRDFYAAVDCVLNPMAGGTGLKIKTVEALGFGRPVIGTRDAFAGLAAEHPAHRAADVAEVVAHMREWQGNAAFRAELALASRLLALRYAAEVARQYDTLAALLVAGPRPAG